MKTNEPFIIEHDLFENWSEFIDWLENEYDEEELPDKLTAEEAKLESIIYDNWLDDFADNFYNYNNERFSECNHDTESARLQRAFDKCFDRERFKKECPKLYYGNNKYFEITKDDFLDDYKQQKIYP